MTNNEANTEQFTGLILLTSEDRPGIAAELFKTLAPFSISVIDMGQIVIRDRVILTVLISLNPDHQAAIESDLANCAIEHEVDIATAFSRGPISHQLSESISLIVTSDKLRPASLALVTEMVHTLGGNITSIQRQNTLENSFSITVSGIEVSQFQESIELLELDSTTTVKLGE